MESLPTSSTTPRLVNGLSHTMRPATEIEPQQALMRHDHPLFWLLIPRFLRHGVAGWAFGLVVLCASVAAAADQEPSYDGRLLSEWLADENTGLGADVVGAPNPPKEAIRAMGTNAL